MARFFSILFFIFFMNLFSAHAVVLKHPKVTESKQHSTGFGIVMQRRDEWLPLAERIRRAVARNHVGLIITEEGWTIPMFTSNTGAFTIAMQIGDESRQSRLLMDTGSDLTWVKCGTSPQMYNPLNSGSFDEIGCASELCVESGSSKGCSDDGICQYRVHYGDGSRSSGELVSDVIAMYNGSGVMKFEGVAFGCGYSNRNFETTNYDGVAGFGLGPLSLPSQLSSNFTAFSYCVTTAFDRKSFMFFGERAKIKIRNLPSQISISYSSDSDHPFFYVNLTAIIIDGNRIEILDREYPHPTIIDSGSTLTTLPQYVYMSVKNTFIQKVQLSQAPSPSNDVDLCYHMSTWTRYTFPTMQIEFDGAITVNLPQENYLMHFSHDTICLMMKATTNLPFNTIGNVLQQNFQVLHDLERSVITFAATNCDTLT